MFNNTDETQARYIGIDIKKIDNITEEAISGAGLEVVDCNGTVFCRGSTNADGLLGCCIKLCEVYILREIRTPEGYEPMNRVYRIYVDGCCNLYVNGQISDEVIIRNTPITGSASFTAIKVNAVNDTPLANAEFVLMQSGVNAGTAVSTATGEVTFTGLSPGTYTLAESIPPAGFQANMDTLTVIVAQNGSVTIQGVPAAGYRLPDYPFISFNFTKVNATTQAALPGAVFELRQNGTVLETSTSTAAGLVTFSDLSAGSYVLVETTPPTGFQTNTDPLAVVVTRDGTVTIQGQAAAGYNLADFPLATFNFTKVNATTQAALPGAVFELRQNGTVIGTSTSTAAGLVTFSGLSAGSYVMVETTPPTGFQANTTPLAVVVAQEGTVTIQGAPSAGYNLANLPLATFSFTNENTNTQAALPGAIFELRQNGTVIGTATANAAGLITFSNLSAGAYTLVETTPSAGFQANTEVMPVVVAQDGTVTIQGVSSAGFRVGNFPLVNFTITKIITGTTTPLAGGIFELRQNAAVIATSTSTAAGLVTFSNLSAGAYTLVETTPPAGYQPNATVRNVVVIMEGSVTIDNVTTVGMTIPNVAVV